MDPMPSAALAALVRDDRVHRAIYTDGDLRAGDARLFGRAWLLLGHDSQLRAVGDFFTTRMGRVPVIVVRGEDGAIRALVNRCTHRGATVCADAKAERASSPARTTAGASLPTARSDSCRRPKATRSRSSGATSWRCRACRAWRAIAASCSRRSPRTDRRSTISSAPWPARSTISSTARPAASWKWPAASSSTPTTATGSS
jgi:hypothetical protein